MFGLQFFSEDLLFFVVKPMIHVLLHIFNEPLLVRIV